MGAEIWDRKRIMVTEAIMEEDSVKLAIRFTIAYMQTV